MKIGFLMIDFGPVLVILVQGMIQPSLSGSFFLQNRSFEVVDADEVNEAAEVLRPEKSQLRTSELSRFLNPTIPYLSFQSRTIFKPTTTLAPI